MVFTLDKEIDGHYDVIICGAGPGGLSCAVTCGRLNKKVLLIDHAGCLGGYWTSGLMGISLDMTGKGGIPGEIVTRLQALHAAEWVDSESYTYDIESMKYVLEELAAGAGVDVLLYGMIVAPVIENNRIKAVWVEGMSSCCFTADWFVDGTGHGSFSSLCGCSYDCGIVGNENLRQPASLEALVNGVPSSWISDIHNRSRKKELFSLFEKAGIECSYPNPLLFRLSPLGDTFLLAINHEYGVNGDDGFEVSRATMHGRREIYDAVRALRQLPGWEDFNLIATSEQLGLRDNRRIHGLSTLTIQDALLGSRFDDGVVPVHFEFDIHELDKEQASQGGKWGPREKSKPFQIPMGSLIARDLDNLFMVGRCISGDFYAHSIYRVTCTASGTGEAAGVALCSLGSSQSAKEVDGKGVAAEMKKRGYAL